MCLLSLVFSLQSFAANSNSAHHHSKIKAVKPYSKGIKKLQIKNENLKATIIELEGEIEYLKLNLSNKEQQLSDSNSKLETSQQDIYDKEILLTDLNSSLTTILTEIEILKEDQDVLTATNKLLQDELDYLTSLKVISHSRDCLYEGLIFESGQDIDENDILSQNEVQSSVLMNCIDVAPIYGCIDPEATNYNQHATHEDETCHYDQTQEEPINMYLMFDVSGSVRGEINGIIRPNLSEYEYIVKNIANNIDSEESLFSLNVFSTETKLASSFEGYERDSAIEELESFQPDYGGFSNTAQSIQDMIDYYSISDSSHKRTAVLITDGFHCTQSSCPGLNMCDFAPQLRDLNIRVIIAGIEDGWVTEINGIIAKDTMQCLVEDPENDMYHIERFGEGFIELFLNEFNHNI